MSWRADAWRAYETVRDARPPVMSFMDYTRFAVFAVSAHLPRALGALDEVEAVLRAVPTGPEDHARACPHWGFKPDHFAVSNVDCSCHIKMIRDVLIRMETGRGRAERCIEHLAADIKRLRAVPDDENSMMRAGVCGYLVGVIRRLDEEDSR